MGGWVGEAGDKGGVKVYEAYEDKKKGAEVRCLLLRRKKDFFFYVYDANTSPGKEKRADIHYSPRWSHHLYSYLLQPYT
jgi:hypothetical protein